MSLEHDMLRLHLSISTLDIPLQNTIFSWPPPARIIADPKVLDDERGIVGFREATDEDEQDFVMVRTNYSRLTDEQADHPNLVRGAEYYYLEDAKEMGFNVDG